MVFFEKYKLLFLQHIKDMVQNELDTTINISNFQVNYIGEESVDDVNLTHYRHVAYEVNFQSDIVIHDKTIIDIEKWVDVASCKMLKYNSSKREYLFEIKLLIRSK